MAPNPPPLATVITSHLDIDGDDDDPMEEIDTSTATVIERAGEAGNGAGEAGTIEVITGGSVAMDEVERNMAEQRAASDRRAAAGRAAVEAALRDSRSKHCTVELGEVLNAETQRLHELAISEPYLGHIGKVVHETHSNGSVLRIYNRFARITWEVAGVGNTLIAAEGDRNVIVETPLYYIAMFSAFIAAPQSPQEMIFLLHDENIMCIEHMGIPDIISNDNINPVADADGVVAAIDAPIAAPAAIIKRGPPMPAYIDKDSMALMESAGECVVWHGLVGGNPRRLIAIEAMPASREDEARALVAIQQLSAQLTQVKL